MLNRLWSLRFPLAAHVKRTGKKAIHLGGGLQLLFGIRGKRWDMRDEYKSLMNEYWIRPSEDETPVVAKKWKVLVIGKF